MDGQGSFGVARRFGSGPARRRVLLIGEEALVAPGPHDQPGSGGLAAALLAAGGAPDVHGVDVDALWDLLPALQAVAGADAPWRRGGYDLAVVVLSGATALFGGVRLHRALLRLATSLSDPSQLLLLLAEPEGRGREARSVRDRSARLLQRLRAQGHELPVLRVPVAADGRFDAPSAVAAAVLARLEHGERPTAGPVRDQDEHLRQGAVDRSLQALGGLTADLQRVVLLARNSFDVPYAQLNLVSRGALHSLAFAGRTSDTLRDTLSGMVVHQARTLLIADTHADERFTAIPETRGPEAIRFYAGHPIESSDGYRIGVLCVFDTRPHPVEEGDEALLRDVAVLAEAEVNALAARA